MQRRDNEGVGQKPASPKYYPQLSNHRNNLTFVGNGKLVPPNSMFPKVAETMAGVV